MASGYPSIFLPLLLLFVATASVAQAGLLGGILGTHQIFSQLTIRGVVYLSTNPTVAVAGATVYLSSDLGDTALNGVEVVTNEIGAFEFIIDDISADLLISTCSVYARVGLSASLYSCGITSDILSIVDSTLGGLLGTCQLPGPFVLV